MTARYVKAYTVYMATFDQVKEVRLRIDDPGGYQDFLEVDSVSELPAAPAPYTAYKVTASGAYVATELDSGATADDYDTLALRISDTRIESYIDADSVDKAECQSLRVIMTRLGSEINVKRVQGGAESIEFVALREMFDYYNDLWQLCKQRNNKDAGNSTGRYGTSDQPEIAGGEN